MAVNIFIITINFGTNPVNGGNPASDIMRIDNIGETIWFNFDVELMSFTVEESERFRHKNTGITRIEYIKKYSIAGVTIFILAIDRIHPMCPIDE